MKRIIAILCIGLVSLVMGTAEAALEFKTTEQKTTSGIQDMKMTFSFPFENKSDKAVEITRVETSCSCLKPYMPDNITTFQPGAKGEVKVEIDLGAFGGKVEKEAYIVTSESQKVTLKLIVDVPQFVKIEPQTLKWEVGEALTPKKMKLMVHKDLNLNLEEVGISKKGFNYEPKVIKVGREYEIVVTPESTSSPEFALLSIKTNSTYPRYKTILGYLSISPVNNSSDKRK